jgi:hypothetical protein
MRLANALCRLAELAVRLDGDESLEVASKPRGPAVLTLGL